jgi:hypothetical protein
MTPIGFCVGVATRKDSKMKLTQLLIAIAATFTLSTPVLANDTVCRRAGIDDCISIQFIVARDTPSLRTMIRDDSANAGMNLLRRIESGRARVHGTPLAGSLFIWLKPTVLQDPSWSIPAQAIRTAQYNRNGDGRTSSAEFITNPVNFPVLDDPRLPGLGQPHYVLTATGGAGGLGWNMPARLLDDIAYMVFCPHGDVTSYPNQISADLGLHFNPQVIANWRRADFESVIEAVLRAR